MSLDDSEHKYQATVQSLVEALQEALQQALRPDRSAFPALLLLYASMDIVASLSRPINHADTNNKIFKAWMDDYMLPGSGLPCSSEDIYAARCGILHTLSVASANSRSGAARRINYVDKFAEVPRLQALFKPGEENQLVVSLPEYFKAFYAGILHFTESIMKDEDLRTRVYHHIGAVALEITIAADHTKP